MAVKTLEDILEDIGAYVDQDTTLPTGTELTVRVNLVNQSLRDWADTYDWSQLRQIGTLSVSLSGTSAALPTNFKKLLSPVYDMSKTVSTDREYVEIDPDERYQRQTSDKVIWTAGDEARGYYVGTYGFTSLFSGVFDYQSVPSSLATLADTAVIQNPNYLVKRTIAYILEARSDARFPLAKQDAELEMRKMVEFKDTPSGAQSNRIPDWPRSTGFVIGED